MKKLLKNLTSDEIRKMVHNSHPEVVLSSEERKALNNWDRQTAAKSLVKRLNIPEHLAYIILDEEAAMSY